ncbi:hypothetical protein ACFY2M_19435 [Streptomyces sp. NPDC001276]|uniref:hypothetical protein n=1 Tax=Streptomyces sp. NPDC001276 TaxID=3364555 RepID=UPI0036AF62F3
MPAHPRAFQRLANQLAATTDPAKRDVLLDEWLDVRDRATEWDADQWGLNPDGWCLKERAAMDDRAAPQQ